MKQKKVCIAIILFISLHATAQIDSNLLLGLVSATTTEINNIANPIAGTLIYNSEDGRMYMNTGSGFAKIPAIDSNSIDFWGVTGSAGTDSNINFLGTTDVTTNLNVDNTIAPIFGTQDYKDDGNNLYEVIGSTLQVKEAGRYDIRANISLLGVDEDDKQRTNVSARIAVNGIVVGAFGGSYIRFQNNSSFNTTSSAHLSEILELNTNDIISIVTFRKANSGEVNFSGINESSFVINKLR